MKLIRLICLGFAFSLLANTAFSESKISVQTAVTCVDEALVEISEEMIGRKYSPRERELKLEALRISPERQEMLFFTEN